VTVEKTSENLRFALSQERVQWIHHTHTHTHTGDTGHKHSPIRDRKNN